MRYDSFSTLIPRRVGVSLPWDSAWSPPPRCQPLATQTPLTVQSYADVHAAARSYIETSLTIAGFVWEVEVAEFKVFAAYRHALWPHCGSELPDVRVYLVFRGSFSETALSLPAHVQACTTPPPRPETFLPAARGELGRAPFLSCLVASA